MTKAKKPKEPKLTLEYVFTSLRAYADRAVKAAESANVRAETAEALAKETVLKQTRAAQTLQMLYRDMQFVCSVARDIRERHGAEIAPLVNKTSARSNGPYPASQEVEWKGRYETPPMTSASKDPVREVAQTQRFATMELDLRSARARVALLEERYAQLEKNLRSAWASIAFLEQRFVADPRK